MKPHHGFTALAILAALALAAGCSSQKAPAVTAQAQSMGQQMASQAPPMEYLARVPSDWVCMVTNRYMGKEQIRVDVNGRTYYGCCQMCKRTLNQDPSSRIAQDPLTGASVDKSKAVVAVLPGGDVLYFESGKNWKKYREERKS